MASSTRRSAVVDNFPQNSDSGRELFEACRSGDLSKVKTLVNAINVNSRDTAGRKSTPLHFAAGFGRKDVVEHLLECGADVTARDDGGLIPLHNACSFGHAEVVHLLLSQGADSNSRDNWNYTPLHEAAIKGKIDVCLVLLQHRADPLVKNLDGKTPLDLSDPAAKNVLTGEYKKDELLEAARSGNEEKLMTYLTPLNVNCHASDGRKSTPLHLAAGYNRSRIVQLLLQQGADVHAKDKGGLVPLHNACSYGHFEVTEMLLKAGANVNTMDLWQFTPLHEAASKYRVEVCSLLLAHGADPTLPNCHNKAAVDVAQRDLQERLHYEFKGHQVLEAARQADTTKLKRSIAGENIALISFKHPFTGDTALHCAVCSPFPKKKQLAELLIRKGPSLINEKNKDFLTALHLATDKSSYDVMELLLEKGTKVNALDNLGQTALHRAAQQGNVQACKLLMAYNIDISIVSLQGYSAAQLATEPVQEFLREGPLTGGTDVDIQLLDAAKTGDMDLVKKLVTAHIGAVNCRDLDGRHSTPLHFAAGYNRLSVVQHLLDNGADVHAKDKGGLVPLHNACSYGHYEVTELLLEHGACVNVADLWKFTPLHEAAAKGKYEICKLLLKHGADPQRRNRDGHIPLDLVKVGDIDTADLLRGDAALLEAAKKGELQRVQKLATVQNINCRDTQGRNSTPLHLAAGYNNVEVAEFLLQSGADVNAQDKGGLIPMHNASSYGHVDIAALLIKHKTCVNAVDKWGFTPLHEAAQKGRTQLCALLLNHGADPSMKNQEGQTPHDLTTADDVKSLIEAAMPQIPVMSTSATDPSSQSTNGASSDAGSDTSSVTDTANFPIDYGSTPGGQGDGSLDREKAEGEVTLRDMSVSSFLDEIGLPQLMTVFAAEHISMDVLVEMTHDSLKDIGVSAYGHRHKILRGIKDLQARIPERKKHKNADSEGSRDVSIAKAPSASTALYELDVVDPEYASVAEQMQSTVREHKDSAGGVFNKYNIIKIQRVVNERLRERYERRREEVADENNHHENERLFFHGSPFVQTIIQRGFDERHAYMGGMFGAGIYFAENSSKSNQYVYGIGGGTGCPAHRDKSCYQCHRHLILCRVTLGKSFLVFSAIKMAHSPPGHHSVTGRPSVGGLAFAEYVVYRGEQAYPEYLITYQIEKPSVESKNEANGSLLP
ncbi:poly [ADP-ribose] polymerase tankyrase-1-like isoform X2 [Watersipora subatra]|uniref:poly [ADP-ribose] polymerase tankyrase-1-like isoform X2 n=1 Tax=Watersipora subatra TaxID=2589382 RepID=UPI00355C1473